MPYIARWLKEGAVVAEERFDHLRDAKDSALGLLAFHRDHNGATHAVVCDDNEVIYLRIY